MIRSRTFAGEGRFCMSPRLTLFGVSFISENAGYEFTFILCVEDTKREVDDLGLVDEKNKCVLVDISVLDLIPFQRHTLARTDLHQDLLTADFIGVPLKQHFSLFELGDAVKLDPPEQHVQQKSDNSPDKPPNTGNPDGGQAERQRSQNRDPALF